MAKFNLDNPINHPKPFGIIDAHSILISLARAVDMYSILLILYITRWKSQLNFQMHTPKRKCIYAHNVLYFTKYNVIEFSTRVCIGIYIYGVYERGDRQLRGYRVH